MKWADLKETLGAAAPVLGTLIAGPAGAAAGAVLAKALGVDPEPLSVAAKLEDPAAIARLAEIVENNKAEFERLALQHVGAMATLEVEDRQGARERDVEIIKLTGHNWRADVLAYGALGALVLCILIAAFADMSEIQERLVSNLISALVVLNTAVFSFEFGASRSDKSGDNRALIDALKTKAGL